MSLLFALFACSTDPTAGTLPDNVGRAFASCQESEIKFLATKHNFQTVFEPCGNNSFGAFSWTPDGKHLYFQLGQTGYVMNAEAENKQTITVPTPSPIGEADWLSSSRLALPVGPEAAGGVNRIAVFDLDQQSVFYRELDHPQIKKVIRMADPEKLLIITKSKPDSPPQALIMALSDGSITPGPSWLTSFDTLDWVITTGFDRKDPLPTEMAVVGKGDTVTIHDGADGTLHGTYEGATAGTLHSGGRWLALEFKGEPISIFYQRAWDDMSDAQRRREQKRAEKLASGLPDSYPTTTRPPMFSLVDMKDGARWNLTSVHGDHFQWYEAQPYWASFIFWGFEGKQFKRNILLGQMGNRLRATELGREFTGMVPANPQAEARATPKPDAP